MKKIILVAIFAVSAIFALAACETMNANKNESGEKTVQVDQNSDKWLDSDSDKIAKEIAGKIIASELITSYASDNGGKKPATLLFELKNESKQSFDVEYFVKKIEDEMDDSKKVDVVKHKKYVDASKSDKFASSPDEITLISHVCEYLGVDFRYSVTVSAQVKATDASKTMVYKVKIDMMNQKDNMRTWNTEIVFEKEMMKVEKKPEEKKEDKKQQNGGELKAEEKADSKAKEAPKDDKIKEDKKNDAKPESKDKGGDKR